MEFLQLADLRDENLIVPSDPSVLKITIFPEFFGEQIIWKIV